MKRTLLQIIKQGWPLRHFPLSLFPQGLGGAFLPGTGGCVAALTRRGESRVSYAIIRNEKYKMGGVDYVGRHNERQNKQYGNPNVDAAKSKYNFHLKAPVEQSYELEFERIRKQEHLLGNIRATGKKQSNVVCEFIVTSDSEFFQGMSQKELWGFFADCYDYVKDKCGEPYVLSAIVHMDKKTPHMTLPISRWWTVWTGRKIPASG